MKYLVRFLLLTIGFALTTAGLMFWHARQFSFEGLWFFDNGFQLHPLHDDQMAHHWVPAAAI